MKPLDELSNEQLESLRDRAIEILKLRREGKTTLRIRSLVRDTEKSTLRVALHLYRDRYAYYLPEIWIDSMAPFDWSAKLKQRFIAIATRFIHAKYKRQSA